MKNLTFALIGILLCSLFTLNAKEMAPNSQQLRGISGNTLKAGAHLVPGKFLVSNNGLYHFRYQHDGNLVLYKNGNKALWSSRTHGKAAGKVIMQYNGNLVIKNPSNTTIWSTNTANQYNRGSRLILQDDGNVVIYNKANKAIWNTGTANPSPPNGNRSVLHPNEFLLPGQKLVSPNGKYHLVYNLAGSLTLFKNGHIQLWTSRTYAPPGKCIMQKSDGNLVIYQANNSPVWSSQTNSYANRDSRLVLQNDGNLVIYKPNNQAIWSTGTQGGTASN